MKKIVLIVLTAMFMVGCASEPFWLTASHPIKPKIRIDNNLTSDKIVL